MIKAITMHQRALSYTVLTAIIYAHKLVKNYTGKFRRKATNITAVNSGVRCGLRVVSCGER